MKPKVRLYITIAITLIIAFVFVGLIIKMIKENGKCIDDPFRYSAIKLKESGGSYDCFCASLNPHLLDFSFDEEGIKIMNSNDYLKAYDQQLRLERPKINFSNINISK